MIRRTSRILLDVMAIAVGAIVLLGAVLAWQLSRGPMELSILNQTVEDLVNSALPGGHLSIRRTSLDWSSQDRRLVILLDEVLFTDNDDKAVAAVPQMALQLSVPALFKGNIAPTNVELTGPSLTLTRQPGGGISFGLSLTRRKQQTDVPTNAVESDFVAPLIEALASEPDTSTTLGYLSRVAIRGASLRLNDEVNDVTLEARNATLIAYRSDQGVATMFESDIVTDSGVSHLLLTGRMRQGAPSLNIRARIWNVVPAAFARLSPAFSSYGSFDVPLDGTASMVVSRKGAVQSADLVLEAKPGKLVIPSLQDLPIPIEKGHLDLHLDTQAHTLKIQSANFEAQGNKASFAGEINYQSAKGFNIDRAGIDLTASGVELLLPHTLAGPVSFDRLGLKGSVDFRTSDVEIRSLSAAHGGMTINLDGAGRFSGAERFARLKGGISNISIRELVALWPLVAAPDARAWVADSMPAGVIPSSRLSVDLTPQMIAMAEAGKTLPNKAVQLSFEVRNASIIFIEKLPLLTNATGRGLLQSDRFEGWIDRASVKVPSGGVIAASKGHFRTDNFSLKDAPGVIQADIAGATPDILELLDMPPLGYISSFGLKPRDLGGRAAGHLEISIPLSKDVNLKDISFKADVRAEEITLRNVAPDLDVTGGALDLNVTMKGLVAKGDIRLNDVPMKLDWHQLFSAKSGATTTYKISGTVKSAQRRALGLDTGDALTGPVVVDATLVGNGDVIDRADITADLTEAQISIPPIGWRKRPGEKAHASAAIIFPGKDGRKDYQIPKFTLTGDGVSAGGFAELDPRGGIRKADIRGVKLGPRNDFDLRADTRSDGVVEIWLEGPSFDAEPLLQRLTENSGDKTKDEISVPFDIRASLDEVYGVENAILTDVRLSLALREGKVHLLDMSGADQHGSPFSARLVQLDNGTRKLNAHAANAGALASAMGLYSNITGGTLEANGIIDDKKQGSPMAGLVTVKGFRVVNAPVLADILTLGSLTGISDTLSGDGIFFEELRLPYRLTDMRYYLDEGRMTGPAMGISVKGSVERKNSEMDLEGTITPAYFLNSFIGRIPIIGPMIVGRAGEGLFAFTYAVRGLASNPKISVNPLSAFAPGFLRRIFEYSTSLANQSPDPDLPPPPVVAPVPVPRMDGLSGHVRETGPAATDNGASE